MATWTTLDWIIIAILTLSGLMGLWRGFAKEIISLIAWVVAFYAAFLFAGRVSQLLEASITNPATRYIVAVVLIFVVVVIVGCIFNKIIHAMLRLTGFGFFDHILGLIFGAARGILIATAALLVIGVTPYSEAAWAKQSQLAPQFEPLTKYFANYLPTNLKDAQTAMNMVRNLATVSDDLRAAT